MQALPSMAQFFSSRGVAATSAIMMVKMEIETFMLAVVKQSSNVRVKLYLQDLARLMGVTETLIVYSLVSLVGVYPEIYITNILWTLYYHIGGIVHKLNSQLLKHFQVQHLVFDWPMVNTDARYAVELALKHRISI